MFWFWFCRGYMSIFVPDKGDKSKVLKTFWFLILHGLISLASHRKFSSESVENKLKNKAHFCHLCCGFGLMHCIMDSYCEN